jgi:hypothetical protein
MKQGKELFARNVLLGVLAAMTALFVAACNPNQGKSPAKPSQGFGASPGATQGADAASPGSGSAATTANRPVESAGTSDVVLADKVKSVIDAQTSPGAVVLDVTAKDGIVTLHGTAATDAERERAARAASSVAGVQSVKNELVIVRGS